MLNTNWFSSKETIEKIYKSNPKLFPEWKDGIGSWNDLGSGFLAGKFKKVKGKRVYTGDKVDSDSLLVSGADSPAKKATKDFEKAFISVSITSFANGIKFFFINVTKYLP